MCKTDQEIVYQAYLKYPEYGKIKKKCKVSKGKESNVRSQLLSAIDKNIFYLSSDTTLMSQKDKLVRKCKLLFQEYVMYQRYVPDVVNPLLEKRVDLMLYQMSLREAQLIGFFRQREAAGQQINLEKIFSDKSMIKIFVQTSVNEVLKVALQDSKFTVISSEDCKAYITASGKKYHQKDCPYCRGAKLIPSTFAKIKNLGLEPCKCVKDSDKVLKKGELSAEDKPKLAKNTMTAFIDESIRSNPWRKWDNTLDERQGSYSYIICRGGLASEQEISRENTLCQNTGLLNEAQSTTYAAIEAISSVLLKIAFSYDFHENVIIYTDNQEAKNKWYQSKVNNYLAHLFESVTVVAIPREQNTVADAIGRKEAYINVPTGLFHAIVRKCNDYDVLAKEMEFVKNYFPNPQKQIPNLIKELQCMADGMEGVNEP